MSAYVLILGKAASGPQRALLALLKEAVGRDRRWRWTEPTTGVVMVVTGPGPTALQIGEEGRALLLGDFYDRGVAKVRSLDSVISARSPKATFEAAVRDGWGRYILMQKDWTNAWSLFRDPSGAIDCITWLRDGLRFVVSDLPAWLTAGLPERVEIDETALAACLVEPAAFQGGCALKELKAVAPGQMRDAAGARMIWSPAAIAGQDPVSRADGLRDLPRVVFGAVDSLAIGRRSVLAEVSGGLDSAIVAASLQRSANAEVVDWLNIYIEGPLADERRYAQDVADKHGLALTIVEKPRGRVDFAALERASSGPRPSLAGLDSGYDGVIARRAQAVGAKALFSGQGGDTVLFHPPTALIAVDHLQARGWAGLIDGTLVELARWRRQSVWTLIANALRPSAGSVAALAPAPIPFAHPEIVRDRSAQPAHPWLTDVADLPPAKRLQIHSLSLTQRMIGASRRGRVVDIVNPLLSQPVVELCLRLNTADLTMGGRDRGLARNAFDDVLPQSIRDRRSKGDGTGYFGRMVATSLPAIRRYLLEGELVRRRLIDPAVLEPMLHEDALLWHGRYLEFLDALSIESWLRMWTRRLQARREASRRVA